MKKYLLIFLVTLSFFSTLPSCGKISVKNKITAYSLKLMSVDGSDNLNEASLSFIRLYRDGTFTSLNDEVFTTGKWILNESTSELTIKEQTEIGLNVNRYKVVSNLLDNNFRLKLLSLNNKQMQSDIVLTYSQSTALNDKKKDLLSVNENLWRKRPEQKETEAQIKKRVLDQLNYHLNYFRMAVDKDVSVYETKFLQSPFNFYYQIFSVPTNENLHETG